MAEQHFIASPLRLQLWVNSVTCMAQKHFFVLKPLKNKQRKKEQNKNWGKSQRWLLDWILAPCSKVTQLCCVSHLSLSKTRFLIFYWGGGGSVAVMVVETWGAQSCPPLHLLLHQDPMRETRRRKGGEDMIVPALGRMLASIRAFTHASELCRKRQEPVISSCYSQRSASSDDSVVPERLDQHSVLHIVEDPADVVGVSSAGEVWVKSLPLLRLVPFNGLLLVHLADVVLGVLGVLPLTCYRGEKEMDGEGWTKRQNMNWDQQLFGCFK